LLFVIAIVVTLGAMGCGGDSSAPPQTPQAPSTIKVTASTRAGSSHTATVTITVTQ
jgi:hypothetical protein